MREGMTAMGQVTCSLTYWRRVWAIVAMPNSSFDSAKKDIKAHVDQLKSEDELLFGKPFTESVIEEAKEVKGMLEHVAMQADLTALGRRTDAQPTSRFFQQMARSTSGRGGARSRGVGRSRSRGRSHFSGSWYRDYASGSSQRCDHQHGSDYQSGHHHQASARGNRGRRGFRSNRGKNNRILKLCTPLYSDPISPLRTSEIATRGKIKI